ncbi:hypothetical protein LX36DRAFT_478991 [Colletotrichum falcatum]|nr:hypothetical protein LX36DRAFT_478991 [Colletotrichum falcatum]
MILDPSWQTSQLQPQQASLIGSAQPSPIKPTMWTTSRVRGLGIVVRGPVTKAETGRVSGPAFIAAEPTWLSCHRARPVSLRHKSQGPRIVGETNTGKFSIKGGMSAPCRYIDRYSEKSGRRIRNSSGWSVLVYLHKLVRPPCLAFLLRSSHCRRTDTRCRKSGINIGSDANEAGSPWIAICG